MAQHKIVFLNGPAGSGKDTAGMAMLQRHGEDIRLYAMKEPMDRALRGFFNYNAEAWQVWERNKNASLNGVDDVPFDKPASLRLIKISFSELFAKPILGEHIFGHLAVHRLYRHITLSKCTIITDSGFAAEAEPLINAFHPRNCLIIQIHRPGHTFEGDSRNYWTLPGVNVMAVHNTSDKQMFIDLIDHGINKWMTAVRA